MNGGANNVTWASAKAKSDEVKGYPSFSTRNNGFFSRQSRKISASLPRFNIPSRKDYREKEKLGRGRWYPNDGSRVGRLKTFLGGILRRMKLQVLVIGALIFMISMFYLTREFPNAFSEMPLTAPTALHAIARRSSWVGGGQKFVIILAVNQGGGVMEWKGPREWAIERDSIKNKKKYAAKWGYDLEMVDMSTKKRYAHEWRESWEKVDTIRNCLRKYPKAEW
jgi:mannan polymerase II complex MNN10 subunit